MNANSNPKRLAILEAAKRVFLDHGYRGASMESIAEAAPVSKPTLYHHFKCKQDLFAAVILDRCENLLSTLLNVQTAREDPASSLKTIASAYVEMLYSKESLEFYRLIIAEQRHFPDFGNVVYRASAAPIFEQLSAYLGELNAEGILHIPDVEAASQFFCGMLQGRKHFRCLMGLQPGLNQTEKEELINAMVSLFLKGYDY